jgi:hypothetical protein
MLATSFAISLSSFVFFRLVFIEDRVKLVHGMHPSSTFQSDTNTGNNDNEPHLVDHQQTSNDYDDIETARLLNILNWSALEDLLPTKTSLTGTAPIDENESKSKNGYNAVQISIELQKKMLR